MSEKQLMIGVPTKDHPKYIQIYLSKVLDDAKAYGIDVHIYDSSENDLTEKIVRKRMEGGYGNLYYHKYDADDIALPPAMKLKDILVGSGYEYVWPCGDGLILNLDNAMPYVCREMQKNRDLIAFNFLDNKGRYTEYNDPVKLILEQWQSLSLYGGTIYKGDFFSEKEWDHLFPIYTDNIQLAGIFDIFAGKPMNVVSADTHFFTGNVYKEEATWIANGRLLEAVVDRMPEHVNNLPKMYDPVKKRVARSFSELRDMLLPFNIWWLRENNNISPKKTIKYRKQLKEMTDTNYLLFLGGSFVPRKTAKKLANIFSYS